MTRLNASEQEKAAQNPIVIGRVELDRPTALTI
jgi:hypothetical protein